MSVGTAASAKVWRRIGTLAREALLRGLSPAELRAILADIARARASAQTAADLGRRWRDDRYVAPAATDPRAPLAVLHRLWEDLPAEFLPMELSPLTALGSATQLSGIGQNRVITTMRGNELVSDPAHPLALEAARRRRSGQSRVHLAAAVRVAHAWDHQPEAPAHELRFGLVSSAPDGGGFVTEADLLDLHLGFWRSVLPLLAPAVTVELAVFDGVLERLLTERGTHADVLVTTGDKQAWSNPYTTAAFRLMADAGEGRLELGDAGFVGWTQALTRNRKDRCLVSGVVVDRLLGLRAP